MAAQGGWSSLPADLVNRVADCLLVTNDLDFYADLRAVCPHWRSVTADPGSNQHDPRFRPSRWVMLDEPNLVCSSTAITDAGPFLFVNIATGRFVRRSLPSLHNRDESVFLTSTTDGLLVLSDREPPYAMSVLNPFTGSMLRFAAPLPTKPSGFTAVCVGGPSPTLMLVSVESDEVYWADPQSVAFSVVETHRSRPASRLPLIAATVNNREPVPAGTKSIFDQLLSEVDYDVCHCCAMVAGGGHMLVVLKRRRGLDVFKIDAAGNVMEKVESIGSQALFLGVRCLVVDTDCFPTVEANYAYFQLADDDRFELSRQRYIYKFNIGGCDDDGQEPELVSPATGIAKGHGYFPCDVRPFTLTQLLSDYTVDIPCHPMMSSSSYLKIDQYIDCFDRDTDDEEYEPIVLEDYHLDDDICDAIFSSIFGDLKWPH